LFLIIPGWLIALFFVLWGDQLMWLLYDQRYAQSGNMLRMLAMGSLISVVGNSYNGLLWARGMVGVSTAVLAIQIVFQVAGMFVGYHFLGEKGVVLSVAVVSWLLYPVDAYVHARIGLWHPKIDLPFIALSALVVALTFKGVFYHV
jgi:O-antigen/teichoic acid export membrane protein